MFVLHMGFPSRDWKFCHNLLILKLFQACMSFFLLMKTKYAIVKNAGTQTVALAIEFVLINGNCS